VLDAMHRVSALVKPIEKILQKSNFSSQHSHRPLLYQSKSRKSNGISRQCARFFKQFFDVVKDTPQ
jgi:hypothetical protein